jgi:toxin ParE1/3/4
VNDFGVHGSGSVRSPSYPRLHHEKWGAEQEHLYIDALWEKFKEILGSPGKWRARPDLFPGCQIASHSRHAILFRTVGTTLQIVRILHGSMDIPRHIPKGL